ncbi:MAG: M20 family metallopeptidase [Rhodobacteraceae bacterium]|nr:M20 family metallopeptidase [Paracoccaceae bacterium]
MAETQITSWLAEQESQMIDLLEKLVNTDSGSYDKPGVDAVGDLIKEFLEGQDIPVDTIGIDTHGDAYRATVSAPGQTGNRPILLMGHRDTVFSKGEVSRRPFHIKDGRAYGPGAADMKAGLVMNAFILAAFAKFGGAPAPLVGLFTGDEEIGSPTSRPHIEAEARNVSAVFNSEPGRPTGNIVTGRKGGIFMRCEVEGKAAHSGANFQEGASAIEELARKIQAWHALTDLERGQTVNIGLIIGGQSVNTVAPSAACDIDVRYIEPDERDEIFNAINEIAQACSVSGTSAELSIVGEFRPMKQSAEAKELFDHYVGNAREAGLSIEGEFSGGCADSGFAAAVGAPTLCGVGPVGGKVHSPDEYLDVDTIVPRAQSVALTILRHRP